MSASTPSTEHQNDSGGLAYGLGAIALALTVLALVLASLFSAWMTMEIEPAPSPDPAQSVALTVGGQRYAVPAAMIAVPSQRQSGFADRLDLALPVTLGDAEPVALSMAIVPRGRATVSARLLDSVYVHQFSDGEMRGAPGLVGKPLEGGAAYRDETVWYDPLAISPFVAKCTRPVAGGASGDHCLRVAPLSDRNLAIYTFDERLLAHWRGFDAAVDAALEPLRR